MYNCIEDILKEAAKDMNGMMVMPSGNNLFEIDNESDHLDLKRKDYFYCVTARLLFISKRARHDI